MHIVISLTFLLIKMEATNQLSETKLITLVMTEAKLAVVAVVCRVSDV
jgi:hypothetical protein